MVKRGDRKRLEVLIEVNDEVHRGWVLRIAEPLVLIDAGVELPAGERLTVHALPGDERQVVEPFEATSVGACEDILAPADAEHRFLTLLEPSAAGENLSPLRSAMPVTPPPRVWSRRVPPTHDLGLLDAALKIHGASIGPG